MVRPVTATTAAVLPAAWTDTPGALLAAQHQWMMSASLAWLDLLASPWQAAARLAAPDGDGPFAGGWPDLPTDANRALVQSIQLWWSPWMPFLLRGGEQLA